MRKLIFIVHTSLDGYIANTDGSFDGLNPGSNNPIMFAALLKMLIQSSQDELLFSY